MLYSRNLRQFVRIFKFLAIIIKNNKCYKLPLISKSMEEISEKEKRIRAITKLYYSNPAIQKVILDFCQNRETVPRYFEGFGKRPDTLTYPSDIIGLVNKGATSFHASEEIWADPLSLKTEMTQDEIKELRKSWDLLIDIDSEYFDISKEAAKLVLDFLEHKNIKNYGIKFSGKKGFHIIVSGKAFPSEFDGRIMNESFPEWPRAITEYIFNQIKPHFRKAVGQIMSFSSLNKKEPESRICCLQCGQKAQAGSLLKYRCPVCNMTMDRKEVKQVNRKIRCLNGKCGGIMDAIDSSNYHFCETCIDSSNEKIQLNSIRHPDLFKEERAEFADEEADLDMVLIAPRHLFRTPYSLNEKTSLASVVLKKEELENFSLKDADPMKVKIRNFMPENIQDEAKILLSDALKWKKDHESNKEGLDSKKYRSYENIDIKEVSEDLFPEPIKKLLNGLQEGKKRGLFILITFLRSLNFPPDYIIKKVGDWNKLNNPPLKEGYVKSQLDWHLRQKKRILPPNYENQSFYKDIGLISKKQDAKNPISEVLRKVRQGNY